MPVNPDCQTNPYLLCGLYFGSLTLGLAYLWKFGTFSIHTGMIQAFSSSWVKLPAVGDDDDVVAGRLAGLQHRGDLRVERRVVLDHLFVVDVDPGRLGEHVERRVILAVVRRVDVVRPVGEHQLLGAASASSTRRSSRSWPPSSSSPSCPPRRTRPGASPAPAHRRRPRRLHEAAARRARLRSALGTAPGRPRARPALAGSRCRMFAHSSSPSVSTTGAPSESITNVCRRSHMSFTRSPLPAESAVTAHVLRVDGERTAARALDRILVADADICCDLDRALDGGPAVGNLLVERRRR